jgi:hypothetical protein
MPLPSNEVDRLYDRMTECWSAWKGVVVAYIMVLILSHSLPRGLRKTTKWRYTGIEQRWRNTI